MIKVTARNANAPAIDLDEQVDKAGDTGKTGDTKLYDCFVRSALHIFWDGLSRTLYMDKLVHSRSSACSALEITCEYLQRRQSEQ